MFTFGLLAVPLSGQVLAEDHRQLANLPSAAQEALRDEMLGNMLANNEILTLVASGKLKEAGQAAESSRGQSAMGKHRDGPFEAQPAHAAGHARHRHRWPPRRQRVRESGNWRGP